LGFKQKKNAKDLLEKKFILDVDYKKLFAAPKARTKRKRRSKQGNNYDDSKNI